MSTNTNDCCATLEKGWAERPRYFPRQLITPDDLTLGQDYLRNKIRRLNRYLHGWGVVCGGRVVFPATPAPWKVVIQPGYILGPFGDEIVLCGALCFDLRCRCVNGTSTDPCSQPADPWCQDAPPAPRKPGKWYIAVRYKEMPSRPVRVQPVGCGCDDSQCEYSRWSDGYEICVLDKCPDSHANPPKLDDLLKPANIPDCPPCPSEPWVVLAAVETDADGNVKTIDNCSCRRMVLTLAPYWWRCGEAALTAPPETAPAPPGGNA